MMLPTENMMHIMSGSAIGVTPVAFFEKTRCAVCNQVGRIKLIEVVSVTLNINKVRHM